MGFSFPPTLPPSPVVVSDEATCRGFLRFVAFVRPTTVIHPSHIILATDVTELAAAAAAAVACVSRPRPSIRTARRRRRCRPLFPQVFRGIVRHAEAERHELAAVPAGVERDALQLPDRLKPPAPGAVLHQDAESGVEKERRRNAAAAAAAGALGGERRRRRRRRRLLVSHPRCQRRCQRARTWIEERGNQKRTERVGWGGATTE